MNVLQEKAALELFSIKSARGERMAIPGETEDGYFFGWYIWTFGGYVRDVFDELVNVKMPIVRESLERDAAGTTRRVVAEFHRDKGQTALVCDGKRIIDLATFNGADAHNFTLSDRLSDLHKSGRVRTQTHYEYEDPDPSTPDHRDIRSVRIDVVHC